MWMVTSKIDGAPTIGQIGMVWVLIEQLKVVLATGTYNEPNASMYENKETCPE